MSAKGSEMIILYNATSEQHELWHFDKSNQKVQANKIPWSFSECSHKDTQDFWAKGDSRGPEEFTEATLLPDEQLPDMMLSLQT
ncbi:hypothetical protein IFR05_003023 [Cadophora sp. M221]|nr:hypothetical protein IFR05_003023 [Cadophora sp. M221]